MITKCCFLNELISKQIHPKMTKGNKEIRLLLQIQLQKSYQMNTLRSSEKGARMVHGIVLEDQKSSTNMTMHSLTKVCFGILRFSLSLSENVWNDLAEKSHR